MSIDVLKQELAGLALSERSQIMAYLVSLQDSQDAAYRAVLAQKINASADAARWTTLEDLDRRLAAKKD